MWVLPHRWPTEKNCVHSEPYSFFKSSIDIMVGRPGFINNGGRWAYKALSFYISLLIPYIPTPRKVHLCWWLQRDLECMQFMMLGMEIVMMLVCIIAWLLFAANIRIDMNRLNAIFSFAGSCRLFYLVADLSYFVNISKPLDNLTTFIESLGLPLLWISEQNPSVWKT